MVVQVNKSNIDFYNNIYEEQKSQAGKDRAIAKALFIKQNQPHIIRRILCCAKPLKDYPDAEKEQVAVIYSSGESGDEENKSGRAFLKMKEKGRRKRIRTLWYRVLAKLKGAVLLIDQFSFLTRRIYLFGTSKKLSFIVEAPAKPSWFIILPESKPRLIWNFIVLLLLMYTAIVVPYRCAFVESNESSDFMQ